MFLAVAQFRSERLTYPRSQTSCVCASHFDSADGMMVGLVTAQMTPLERSGVADSIGFADTFHDTVAYMLTLGVLREYRRAVSYYSTLVSSSYSF
jgi:hypothetical protein